MPRLTLKVLYKPLVSIYQEGSQQKMNLVQGTRRIPVAQNLLCCIFLSVICRDISAIRSYTHVNLGARDQYVDQREYYMDAHNFLCAGASFR